MNSKNVIESGCYVAESVKLGYGNRILRGTVIEGDVTIGNDNVIGPMAVIGTPPQHRQFYDEGHKPGSNKIIIGDRNVIREFTTIHEGLLGITRIGNHCFMMAYSHVSHDTQVFDNAVLANCSELGGHSRVHEGVYLGLNTAVHQYSTIGAYSITGMGSIVTHDIPPFLVYKNFSCYKLNLVGLQRAGFSETEIETIRRLYSNIDSFDDVRASVMELKGNDRIKRCLLDFFENRNSKRKIAKIELVGE
jgi:UDP-N-acetylglucosamine acyltransferase